MAQEAPSCFEPGECMNSLYLGSLSTHDIQECLDFCQDDTPDCAYFTFFEENGICDAFANCDQFDSLTCQYCYSGASDCDGEFVHIPKIMFF